MEVLTRQLMQPDLLADFIASFNAEWERPEGDLKTQATTRSRDRAAIDRRIANLVDAISDGRTSPAIIMKLRQLEEARGALSEPTQAPAPLLQVGPRMADRYAETIRTLTAAIVEGDDPEAVEIVRSLIDQVIIQPDLAERAARAKVLRTTPFLRYSLVR